MRKGIEIPYALEISDLNVHYGLQPVLWDVCLSVPKGSMVGIIGPNGAGKSTLIRSVLGLVKQSTGIVRFLGKPLEAMRHSIAYIPQKECVDWTFPITVRELVTMGTYPKRGFLGRLSPKDIAAVEEAMELLGMASMADRHINQLSGGQQQRAFLARALVQNADLYFLDEPFRGVDHTSEQLLIDTLKAMKLEGKTIFVVHHDLLSAKRYFDWLILLNMRLVQSGPTRNVFTLEYLQQTYGEKLSLVEEALRLTEEKR
jgi:manganese/zinc/iron transport system ATP- binding protein